MHFKVITPVQTEPVTLDEARLQVKAIDGVTEDDPLLATWITAAREVAEHYTGRALAAQTLEAALDRFPCGSSGHLLGWQFGTQWETGARGQHRDCIDLPMPPVASVTSIKYTDPAGVEQTLSTNQYALSTYGQSRTINPAFGVTWPATQCIPDAVRIQFVAGYAKAPRAVKSAILLMLTWFNEHRGDEMDPHDIQPPAAKALLDTVKSWALMKIGKMRERVTFSVTAGRPR
jgi:hypothetical protein